MIPIIGPLVGMASTLVELGRGVVDNWQKRQTLRAEHEAKLETAKVDAQIRYLEAGQKAEIDWDLLAAGQMAGSWKDEWFVWLLSVPLVLGFIPQCREWVFEGFKALEAMPNWYQASLGVAIASSFGYRKLVDIFTAFKK